MNVSRNIFVTASIARRSNKFNVSQDLVRRKRCKTWLILGNAFSGNFYRSSPLKFQHKLQEKLTEVKEPITKLKGKFWVRFILLSLYLSSGLPHRRFEMLKAINVLLFR